MSWMPMISRTCITRMPNSSVPRWKVRYFPARSVPLETEVSVSVLVRVVAMSLLLVDGPGDPARVLERFEFLVHAHGVRSGGRVRGGERCGWLCGGCCLRLRSPCRALALHR